MSKGFLLTGGIGDFVTIESYTNPQVFFDYDTVYLGTPAAKGIAELYSKVPCEPWNRMKWVIVDADWKRLGAFIDREELKRFISGLPQELYESDDWSGTKKFPLCTRDSFVGSQLLKNTIASIDLELPENFYTIVPYTTARPNHVRYDITPQEWKFIIDYLELTDTYGVIISTADPNYKVPESKRLINLLGKTTIGSAVEILKKSIGYIGIDSFLSVLAAQLFDQKDLLIKSKSVFLYGHKNQYYAPHKNFEFIVQEIKPLSENTYFNSSELYNVDITYKKQYNYGWVSNRDVLIKSTSHTMIPKDYPKSKKAKLVGKNPHFDINYDSGKMFFKEIPENQGTYVALNILQHLPNPALLLENIPDGELIVNIPHNKKLYISVWKNVPDFENFFEVDGFNCEDSIFNFTHDSFIDYMGHYGFIYQKHWENLSQSKKRIDWVYKFKKSKHKNKKKLF